MQSAAAAQLSGRSVLSISQCRRLLPSSLELADREVERLRDKLYEVAELVIDAYDSCASRAVPERGQLGADTEQTRVVTATPSRLRPTSVLLPSGTPDVILELFDERAVLFDGSFVILFINN